MWIETSATEFTIFDWELWVYDRATGTSKVLAHNDVDDQGKGVPGTDVFPRLSGNEVLYSAVSWRDRGLHLDSFAVDIATGQRRLLAKDAKSPTRLGQTYLALRRGPRDGVIDLIAFQTDGDLGRPLKRGAFSDLVSCGSAVGVLEWPGKLVLMDVSGRARVQVSGLRQPRQLACGGQWFTWAQLDASYAVRLADGLVVRLGTRDLANTVHSSDESIIWADQAKGSGASVTNGVLLPAP